MLPVGPPTTAAEQRKKMAVVDPAAREALNVVFAPQGSFVQDLLLTGAPYSLALVNHVIGPYNLGCGVAHSFFDIVALSELLFPKPHRRVCSRRVIDLGFERMVIRGWGVWEGPRFACSKLTGSRAPYLVTFSGTRLKACQKLGQTSQFLLAVMCQARRLRHFSFAL